MKATIIKQPAITVRQPWASLIIEPDNANPGFGIKPIENRTWKCPKKYIGKRVLIHAGMDRCNTHISIFTEEQRNFLSGNKEFVDGVCVRRHHPFGAIIGSVEIVDCVINHPSIWAEKTKCRLIINKSVSHFEHVEPIIYNWVLANPIKFNEPIPCKGKLSFWEYEGVLPEKY